MVTQRTPMGESRKIASHWSVHKDVNKMQRRNEEEKAFSGKHTTTQNEATPSTSINYPLGDELETHEYRWRQVFHCLHYGKYFKLQSKCLECPLLLSWYGRTRT